MSMRNILSLRVTLGFLAILAVMLLDMVEIKDNPTMSLMFGSLTTAFGAVLNWHFGSSSGSERKSDLLAQAAPPAATTPSGGQ